MDVAACTRPGTKDNSEPSKSSHPAHRFAEQMDALGIAGDFEGGWKVYRSAIEEGVPCDNKFFKSAADSLGEERLRQSGVVILEHMYAQRLNVTATVQNKIICAWKSHLPPHLVTAFEALKAKEGQKLSRTAYRCLMVAHESERPDRTLELYNECQEKAISLDRVGLSAAMSAFAQFGKVEKALEISDHMAKEGLPASAKGHGVLLKACTRCRKMKEAITVFGRMQADGVNPNRHAYHDVIQCHVKEQRLDKAVSMYQEMVDANVVPLDSTRSFMKLACLKRGFSEQDVASKLTQKTADSEEASWRSEDSSTPCQESNMPSPSEDSD